MLLQAVPNEAVKLLLQPLLQQLEVDLGEGKQVISRVRFRTRTGAAECADHDHIYRRQGRNTACTSTDCM